MNLDSINDDGRALQALSEATDYLLVVIGPDDHEGGQRVDVYASAMKSVPFLLDVGDQYYTKHGQVFRDDD